MQIRHFIYTLLFGILLGSGLPGLGIYLHYKLTSFDVNDRPIEELRQYDPLYSLHTAKPIQLPFQLVSLRLADLVFTFNPTQ